jgi:hypothetical protein
LLKAIRQGNPAFEPVPSGPTATVYVRRPVTVRANEPYPDEAPASSVPPSLLSKLPPLPQALHRFVGRDLILRDPEAGLIVDFISAAVPLRLPRQMTAPHEFIRDGPTPTGPLEPPAMDSRWTLLRPWVRRAQPVESAGSTELRGRSSFRSAGGPRARECGRIRQAWTC